MCDNVLLSGDAAMVTDFGIAKAISAARTSSSQPVAAGDGRTLTQAGLTIGTPAYMAPEQAAGDVIDHRVDIYAWGMVAYEILAADPPPERFVRICDRALARGGFVLRDLDMKRKAEEFRTVKRIYNGAWEKNWGFVPLTDAEFEHAAKDLAMLVDPRVFIMVERGGKTVGFAGLIPDINEALVGLDGRLFPFGLFKLLSRKKRVKNVRVMLLGLLPEARGRGVDAAIFVRSILRARECGYRSGEAGWILEDNHRMRADIEACGGRIVKRYRLYECAVTADG